MTDSHIEEVPPTGSGPGWRVRESPRAHSPLSASPPQFVQVPPAAERSPDRLQSPRTGRRRRSTWIVGVTGTVALFAVAGGLAVFLSGGRAVATLPVTAIDGTSASPSPRATPTLDPAAVAKAGQQYLASATTVNQAIDNFFTAYNQARLQPCGCPPGQFDVGPAFAFEPAVVRDLAGFRETLRQMRSEVPEFEADIDAAIAGAEAESSDLGSAAWYSAGVGANATSGATYLQLFGDDLTRGGKIAAKLRAELGLPPPPLVGTEPSASASGPLV